MSLPIYVDAYACYKPTERPQQFVLDEEIYAIAAVLDQSREARHPAQRHFSHFRNRATRQLQRSRLFQFCQNVSSAFNLLF
jgi:hypothetical protein